MKLFEIAFGGSPHINTARLEFTGMLYDDV
jgi:hypothetical protein